MSRRVWSLLTCLLVALLSVGSVPPAAIAHATAPPQLASPSDWHPAQLRAALRRVAAQGAVGVVAEVRTGTRVWRGAAGHSDLDPLTPAQPRAAFRAGSITKTAVAVLALQEVARGRWDLDETTLGQVLPGRYPGHGEVTLRQLLAHSSGVPDYLSEMLRGANTIQELRRRTSVRRTDAELVRLARKLRWRFDPGTKFSYSNTGYILIGMMLEHSLGRPLPQLLRRRVFEPAGMTHTYLAVRRGLPANALTEYILVLDQPYGMPRFHPSAASAAGAMVSTAADLNRLLAALDDGRLLPRRWVREMRAVQSRDPSTGETYGLGMFRVRDPCIPGLWVYGHDGSTYGTVAFTLGSPGGRRRVSIGITGVDEIAGPPPAFRQFLRTALRQGC